MVWVHLLVEEDAKLNTNVEPRELLLFSTGNVSFGGHDVILKSEADETTLLGSECLSDASTEREVRNGAVDA